MKTMINALGKLIVVSGPSGCGKGTVLRHLLREYSNIFYSVSATTRAPRPEEKDGIHYYFISKERFRQKIENGEMLEYTEYVGNYYGTPKDKVVESLNMGRDVVLEIEVEGAMNVKKAFPEAVLVFIKPPSMEELEKRLIGRGTDDIEIIASRLKKATEELKHIDAYDYLVVNDEVDRAVADIASIIRSEKLKINK